MEPLEKLTRWEFLKKGTAGLLVAATPALWAPEASAAQMKDSISSRAKHRPKRNITDLIILHTTESNGRSALNSLTRRGEANYLVAEGGTIYRIIPSNILAKHCGRSMWNGKKDIDRYSIGIEVAGYHTKEPTNVQYTSLRWLLDNLQKRYGVSDRNVLPHSMIAYGTPNRWHSKSHRGRKRCGMLFATDGVRKKLGLKGKPSYDPDVKAKRLVVADKYLENVLYGDSKNTSTAVAQFKKNESDIISRNNTAWSIARDLYDDPDTLYIFPDGKKINGDKIKDWRNIPAGTKVMVDCPNCEPEEKLEYFKKGDTPFRMAGNEYDDPTTIYFFNNGPMDGWIRTGEELKRKKFDFNDVPIGTGILVGYEYRGKVLPNRSMWKICGKDWNLPSTIYRFPDKTIHTGDDIQPDDVPRGTIVLFKK